MFKDKVVLITGASQGIGKLMALKFASLGAKVALNDIPSQEENLKKVAAETNGKYYLADVSKMDQVENMMNKICRLFLLLPFLNFLPAKEYHLKQP